MSRTIYRILGGKGRTTIPLAIRKEVGFRRDDVLSFTAEGDEVLVRREKLRGRNEPEKKEAKGVPLEQFLDSLSPTERYSALIYLSVKWAQEQEAAKGKKGR